MADIHTIKQWLADVGYTVEPVDDVPEEITAFVCYIVEGQRFEVVLHSQFPARLLIQRNLNLAREHQAAIMALSHDAFREFRFNLVRDLLRSEAAYHVAEDGQKVESVSVQLAAHLDDIRANDLIKLISKVRDASVLAAMRIRKAAGAPL